MLYIFSSFPLLRRVVLQNYLKYNQFWIFKINFTTFFFFCSKKGIKFFPIRPNNIVEKKRLRFWFKELCNELLLLGTNFILLIYYLCMPRFTRVWAENKFTYVINKPSIDQMYFMSWLIFWFFCKPPKGRELENFFL